ncbi:hypothetical protein [Pseudomonas entomophila]|uniref:hypothetical protein n=1 Tax=Pseudomonas entomophila TaxID=312306 RepID=UPI001F007CD3|nr:hypothetical protein [Pseudomonas entomophila]MCG8293031.1 hypothetical protein [Pseudomonas entomophila]
MSTRKRIDGLRRQFSALSEDQTVMEISKIMDELSAAATGGNSASTNDLATLFSDLEAEQNNTQRGIEPCN